MTAPTLINCTIRHEQWYTSPDSGDSGVDTDVVPLMGPVRFIPQLNRAALASQYAVQLGTITGYIDTDGQLKASKGGAVGVRLVANDPVLNLQSLPYKVEFSLTTAGGVPVPVAGTTFTVPATDTTVWLSSVLPMPGATAQGNAPTSVTASQISDSSAIGRSILTAADQAAVQAIIGAGGSADEYHEYANVAGFPGTGVTDRIYLAQDTGKLYRWNGSAYAQIADKASVGLGNVDNVKTDTTLPSTVPTNRNRPHFYNPLHNAYNWKGANTRKLRASLARAANGGLRHWAMVGDSIMAGYMGDGASPQWEPTKAYPRIMRSYLAAQGIPVGGTGFVPACDSLVAVTDSRWSTTGTWTIGGSARVMVTTQNGATATFASDTPGTQVDVYFHGTSGTATVAIDGGTATAVTMSGLVPAKYTVTGLANTTHSVVITSTSGTAFAFSGAAVTNTAGLVIHNVAQGFSQSSTWADTSDQLLNDVRIGSLTLSGITPDVVFIELGGNDHLNSVSSATFKTNMTTLRNQFSSSDVVLVHIPSWTYMLEEMYDLADQFDCPLVDWYDRYGGSTLMTAAGLMTDSTNIHTNQAWHLDAGRNLGLLVAQ